MRNTIGKICFSLICSGLMFSSCYKKPIIENTATVTMSGEWFAQYYDDADPTTPLNDFDVLLTYNTSDNSSTQMWVDDHFWSFKSKVSINTPTLTFGETATAENLESPGTNIKVYEGKVLKNAGTSKTGNVVDSIYLKVEFLDDEPGVIYQIRGHMKTGFIEDEY